MSRKFDPFAARPRAAGCDPFVTALDVRSRGALADSAAPILEAHLAICEGCRQRAERLAALPPPSSATPVDWQEARAALLRRLRHHQLAPWFAAAALVLMPLLNSLAQLAVGDAPRPSWRQVPATILIFLAGFAVMRFFTRKAARRLATDDLVAAYRRDLESVLREARMFVPACVAAALGFAVHALVLSRSWTAGPLERFQTINSGLAALILGGVTWYYGREARRTARALQELG